MDVTTLRVIGVLALCAGLLFALTSALFSKPTDTDAGFAQTVNVVGCLFGGVIVFAVCIMVARMQEGRR